MSELKEALIKRLGEHRVLDAPVREGEIPLLILDLELRTPVTVIVTNGLSNYKMPVPEKLEDRAFNEIYFCLPDYWEWEDTENPQMNWVFPWIQRLAKHVVEKETWYGHGHTMPCGKDAEPISATMKQNHLLLADPMLLESHLAPISLGNKTVNFLSIIPVFKDEFEYKQARGTFKLIAAFINKGVTEKLDDFRSSVRKSRWRMTR